MGHDGTDFGNTNLAKIHALADGSAVADSNSAGALVFSTTPNGAGAVTEAMRIDKSQSVGVQNNAPSSFDVDARQLVVGAGVTDAGITIVTANSTNNDKGSIFFADGVGTSAYRGQINYYHSDDSMRFATSGGVKARFDANGALLIGDTANADMTVGLTINQGANDDQALAFKSSDVAHGVTDEVETDTWGEISKSEATSGGLNIKAYKDADGSGGLALRLDAILSEDVSTTKTTAGRGLFELIGSKAGGTALANVVDAGNVFQVVARRGGANETIFIVDENGALYADAGTTTTAVTVYDNEDDLALVRALDIARAENGNQGIIRNEFDKWATSNEGDLVRLGILGAPLVEGGLVNITGLQQLHNGAIWQLNTKHMTLVERVDSLSLALEAATTKIAALTAPENI